VLFFNLTEDRREDRQEDRREDRQEDRREDRQEDRREDRQEDRREDRRAGDSKIFEDLKRKATAIVTLRSLFPPISAIASFLLIQSIDSSHLHETQTYTRFVREFIDYKNCLQKNIHCHTDI